MIQYEFKWRDEAKWALITFIVFVGGAFAVSSDMSLDEWGDWVLVTLTAGARAAVAGFIVGLRAALSARNGGGGP